MIKISYDPFEICPGERIAISNSGKPHVAYDVGRGVLEITVNGHVLEFDEDVIKRISGVIVKAKKGSKG